MFAEIDGKNAAKNKRFPSKIGESLMVIKFMSFVLVNN